MPLTKEETRFYQQTLAGAQRQLEQIDQEIEQELTEIRERLAVLRDKRRAAQEIYDNACKILGIPNDTEDEEERREGSKTEAPM
jgi:hypothetical protein